MKLGKKFRASETAVLVLDIQNDFCHEDGAFSKVLGWDAEPIRLMVPKLGVFVWVARECGCKIVWSQMMNHPTRSPRNLIERLAEGPENSAGRWPFGLLEGSWGWSHYLLNPDARDIAVTKAYYDLLSVPALLDTIREAGIKNLVVTGVYAEVCVAATAQRGFTEGFNVMVPRDLVASTTHRTENAAVVLDILGYCAQVTTSEEIALAWRE